jgi:peptidoglycan/LPS O-acetylase OafA/YrhL
MRPDGQGGRLLGIQLARGAAAVLVVLYHAGRGLALPQYLGHVPLGGLFNFGHAGIDFFFVLSGFIIFTVHHGDIGRPSALPRYVWRRLARIYPIYWVVTAIVIALALLKPDAASILAPDALAKSLLLLPQRADPLLGVAWTLVEEMVFYTAFALLIASRPLGLAAALAWAAVLAVGLAGVSYDSAALRLLNRPYNLQFLFGIAAAWAVLHAPVRRPFLLATAGAALFLLTGLVENAGLIETARFTSKMLFGLGAAATVLGLAAAERQGRLHVGRAGALLGNASYSIYLVHTIVIGLVARALPHLPDAVALLVVAAIATAAGIAVYRAVEQPMLAWLVAVGPKEARRGLRPSTPPRAEPLEPAP